jgi:hypothetical protein
MIRLVAALALLAAPPSLAAGLASQPADDTPSAPPGLEGIYAALGGGGGLMVLPGNNSFGYAAEARLGYSFMPALQVYVSGAMDWASFSGSTFRAYQVVAVVQYHLVVRPAVMLYGRAGAGIGFSKDGFGGNTASGFAGTGGLGIEFRIAPNLYLAPEFFYRQADLSASGTDTKVQVGGLQVSIVYY